MGGGESKEEKSAGAPVIKTVKSTPSAAHCKGIIDSQVYAHCQLSAPPKQHKLIWKNPRDLSKLQDGDTEVYDEGSLMNDRERTNTILNYKRAGKGQSIYALTNALISNFIISFNYKFNHRPVSILTKYPEIAITIDGTALLKVVLARQIVFTKQLTKHKMHKIALYVLDCLPYVYVDDQKRQIDPSLFKSAYCVQNQIKPGNVPKEFSKMTIKGYIYGGITDVSLFVVKKNETPKDSTDKPSPIRDYPIKNPKKGYGMDMTVRREGYISLRSSKYR